MNPETPKLNITPKPEKILREKTDKTLDKSVFSYSEEQENTEWPYGEKQLLLLDENKNRIGQIQFNYPETETEEKLFKTRIVIINDEYKNKDLGITLYKRLIDLAKEKGLDGIKSDNSVVGGAIVSWKKLADEGYNIKVNPRIKEKYEELLKLYNEGKFFKEGLEVPKEESVFELILNKNENQEISPELSRNIEEVFRLNPELVSTAEQMAGVKEKIIRLYRVYNPDAKGVVEKGQEKYTGKWFSSDIDYILDYVEKNYVKTENGNDYTGLKLSYVDLPLSEARKNLLTKEIRDTEKLEMEEDNFIIDNNANVQNIDLGKQIGVIQGLYKTRGALGSQRESLKQKLKEVIPVESEASFDEVKNFRFSKEVIQLYAKYLETNFPNYEKNILWHGSASEKIEGEIRTNERDSGYFGTGFYVTAYISNAKIWGKNLHPMIIPVGKYAEIESEEGFKNIKYIGDSEKANIEAGGTEGYLENEEKWSKRFTETLKQMGNIGARLKLEGHKDTEIVVFDPSQIHILGSKEDLEKFDEYLNKK
jgi:hypothetical protein